MRELKILEILCDALYYPFATKMFTLDSLGHIQPLSRVCGLLYKLIKHIVQDNRENEEYAAQWIELFFDHAVNIGETSESYSENTITAILTNNKKLLDQQISKENISHIIQLCKNQRKHERFLNLLTCLCICQEEAVIGNQNDIVEILMESEETKDIFVIPIRENNGGYEIFLTRNDTGFKDQWIDLREIKNWSEKNDSGRMYNYYLAFLSLATSLCYDRSYKGINAFLPIFPVEITFGCAKMDELPFAMKSRFTDLLLTLHVDKQPLEPLRVPVLTRMWDVFEDEDDDMPVKEKVPESLNVLKDFVKDYLINSKGQQNSYEKEKNGMTLSVLKLARSLVLFGFYRTEDELIEMIDPLITLLDGSHDQVTKSNNNAFVEGQNDFGAVALSENNSKRYEMTESNLNVINCKNKMCEILGIVMDIQNDIRVTKFLREFNNKVVHEVYQPSTIMKKNTLIKLGLDVDKKGHEMSKKLFALFEKLLEDKKLDLEVLSYADYVCINLDLILYKNEGLLNRSFSLLVRFHSQRRSLLDLLRSVQMLESDQAIDTLKRVWDQLTELRKIAQNSEFWLGQTDRESVLTAKKTVDIFNYLSSLLSMPYDDKFPDEEAWMKGIADNNPFLTVDNNSRRRRSSLRGGQEENKNSKNMDKDLLDFINEEVDLESPLPLDSERPIQEYQRMLRNLEAHQIVMTIIKQNSIKGVQSMNLYHKVLK